MSHRRLMPGRVPFDRFLKGRFLRNLDVKGCLMQKIKQERAKNPWEKSMLSRWWFLAVGSPDCGHYSLGNVDGVESDD